MSKVNDSYLNADFQDFPELTRLHVPLKSYTGDLIPIPDDIPLRDNPISIETQLATLGPIRSVIQEMKKENEKKRQKRIQKCSKILECELGKHFSQSEPVSSHPIRARLGPTNQSRPFQ